MGKLVLTVLAAALVGSSHAWGGYDQCYRYSLPGDKRWPSKWEFEALREATSGEVHLKGEEGYKPFTFSTRTNTPQPAVIVHPESVRDVKEAIGFARENGMRLSVQSTGHHHDIRNIADNAVHLVMSNFNHKKVVTRRNKKYVVVGPGQTFAEISSFVQSETNGEWALATGADSTVGPYGWSTGGGHGYLSRMYGYGADHLVSMRVVLTNERVVTASETRHRELFRALRGSGGSAFGICVSMMIRLHPTPKKVTSFVGMFFPHGKPSYTALVQSRFSDFIANAPKEAGGYYITMGVERRAPVIMVAFCYGDDCDRHISKVAAIPGCVPRFPGSCVTNATNTYYNLINSLPPSTGGNQYAVSTAVKGEDAMATLRTTTAWVMKQEALQVQKFCTQSSVLGGKAADLDPLGEETSISPAMRDADIQVTCIATWQNTTTVAERKAYVAGMTQWSETTLRPLGAGWVYWNEPQHDFPANDWKERYWGCKSNYRRMQRVKRRYDPENALTCYHCIGWDWDFDEKVDPAVCPEQSCTCSNTAEGTCNAASS